MSQDQFQSLSLGRNHYESLGLDNSASSDQIKKKYLEKAKLVHPDKTQTSATEELMKELNKIKSVLLDDVARRKYDEELASKTEPDIPLFMRENRGKILLPQGKQVKQVLNSFIFIPFYAKNVPNMMFPCTFVH